MIRITRPGRFFHSADGAVGAFSTTLANSLLWLVYHFPPLTPPPPGFMAATPASIPSSSACATAADALSLTSSSTTTTSSSSLFFSSTTSCIDPWSWVHSGLAFWGSNSGTAASCGASGFALCYPFASLFVCGVAFRLVVSLPWTLYGELALRRLHRARPALVNAYQAYLLVARHPKAISWEKKVAAERLAYSRRGILRYYRTNNILIYLPFLCAAGCNLSFLAGPVVAGGLLGSFLVQHSFPPIVGEAGGVAAAAAAASSPALPLAVSALQAAWYCPSPFLWSISPARMLGGGGGGGSSFFALSSSSSSAPVVLLMDPTLAMAALLTLVNLSSHFSLRGREGMGAKAKAVQQRGMQWSRRLCGTAAIASGGLVVLPLWSVMVAASGVGVGVGTLTTATATSSSPLLAWEYFLVVMPSYVAPVWLGMAVTTLVKNRLTGWWWGWWKGEAGRRSGPKGTAAAPPHEKEDEEAAALATLDTSNTHPYKLSFTGEEAEERREMWKVQRKLLEYECDVRLFRYARRLWTPAEELEDEAEKLRRKAAVARERRQERQRQHRGSRTTPLADRRNPNGGGESEAPEKSAAFDFREGAPVSHCDPTTSSSSSSPSGGKGMTEEEQLELKMIVKAQEMRNAMYEKRYGEASSSSSSAEGEAGKKPVSTPRS